VGYSGTDFVPGRAGIVVMIIHCREYTMLPYATKTKDIILEKLNAGK